MAIRVTQSMMSRGFLANLNAGMKRMDQLQTKLYTGKEINKLSDDPLNLQTLLRIDTTQNETEQYMTNIEYMITVQASTEQVLNTTIDTLSYIKTLSVKALNDTMTLDERSIMAADVASMLEHLIEVANTERSGTFVMAGTDLTHRPFNPETDDDGIPYYTIADELNGEARIMEIGNDVTFKFNLTAYDVYGPNIDDPDAADGNIFAVMRRLSLALQEDNWEDMNTAFGELSEDFYRINHLRSEYGTIGTRMNAAHTRFFNDLTTIIDHRSSVEDVDMAEAIMYLKTQETVYRTALETGARLLPPTLVDYLR